MGDTLSVSSDARSSNILNELKGILEDLKFGNVVLTVHEGATVQIDVTEKRRIRPS